MFQPHANKARRNFLGFWSIALSIPPAWVGNCNANAPRQSLRYVCLEGGTNPHFEVLTQLSTALKAKGKELMIHGAIIKATELHQISIEAKRAVSAAPDVIFTNSGPIALAIARETTTIPIAFLTWGDPIAEGLTTNLGEPTRNLTGVSYAVDTTVPLLQLVKLGYPSLKSLAIIVDEAGQRERFPNPKAFAGLGYEKVIVAPCNASEVASRIVDLQRKRAIDSALLGLSINFLRHTKEIAAACSAAGVVSMSTHPSFVEKGMLISYHQVAEAFEPKMARILYLLLQGVAPRQIPIETPKRFECTFNLRVMRAYRDRPQKQLLDLVDRFVDT